MIKSKERILKHQYNRREFVQGALKIVTTDITLSEAAKLSVAFLPDMFAMGSADVTGQDKMNIKLIGREFHGTLVFVELTGWSLIRWYLTVDNIALKIVILITITVGVYLWLK